MLQILKGSQFDGYFENVAARLKSVLTPETRHTILELKYLTPDDEHIMGIEYYQAVIADNVKTYHEFIQWRKKTSGNRNCNLVSVNSEYSVKKAAIFLLPFIKPLFT